MQDTFPHSSFTKQFPGACNAIIIEMVVSIPHDYDYDPLGEPQHAHVRALIDTGASHCFLTDRLIAQLNIKAHIDFVSEDERNTK